MSAAKQVVRFLTVAFFLLPMFAPDASARFNTRMYDPLYDGEELPESGATTSPLNSFLGLLPEGFSFLRPVDNAVDVTERFFDQRLDPSSPSDLRTFKQRYYVYSKHAPRGTSETAPVILYIGGESELLPASFLNRLAEVAASKFGAHLVALEHRYYGKSQPFKTLTTENLKYLSSSNAIEDLARFQRYLTTKLKLKGPWISIGGSYPGSLSAYYRLKHPELVVGALASSAPVEARNAFVEYDEHVTRVLPPACAQKLRDMTEAAHRSLDAGPESALRFKNLFGAQDIQNEGDFLYTLADITAYAVQYGAPEELCSSLEGSQDAVEAYAAYVRTFLERRKTTAVDFSPAVAGKLGARESEGMRQWYYQSCTEFGYWQDAHPDAAKSVRSNRLDQNYDRGICQRFFGLNQIADESRINREYYEPLLSPSTASRILFTNGSVDPWLELSINAERGNAVNPETSTFVIQGKAHCSDLRSPQPSDPEALRQARSLFLSLAAGWLR
jgi:pimeloyl-ACP methyl ester carboxylesterase